MQLFQISKVLTYNLLSEVTVRLVRVSCWIVSIHFAFFLMAKFPWCSSTLCFWFGLHNGTLFNLASHGGYKVASNITRQLTYWLYVWSSILFWCTCLDWHHIWEFSQLCSLDGLRPSRVWPFQYCTQSRASSDRLSFYPWYNLSSSPYQVGLDVHPWQCCLIYQGRQKCRQPYPG